MAIYFQILINIISKILFTKIIESNEIIFLNFKKLKIINDSKDENEESEYSIDSKDSGGNNNGFGFVEGSLFMTFEPI